MGKRAYVLASGSPRRKEILNRIGIPFTVRVSDADETVEEGMPPEEIVQELSRRKAYAAAQKDDKELIVIAADTLVALDGKVLGKPLGRNESEQMIRSISGRAHQVYTGVTLLKLPEGERRTFYSKTEVYVKPLRDEEIRAYVESGEGDDKAGAYAIQGEFGKYISSYEGDYDNVVGFPAKQFLEELKAFEEEDEEEEA